MSMYRMIKAIISISPEALFYKTKEKRVLPNYLLTF